MRGEEFSIRLLVDAYTELPPHARRRVCSDEVLPAVVGITSACAEKSLYE